VFSIFPLALNHSVYILAVADSNDKHGC